VLDLAQVTKVKGLEMDIAMDIAKGLDKDIHKHDNLKGQISLFFIVEPLS